jgi:hypothetical protein
MSRAFLILTTQPAPANTDPSERSAVLAARREATVDAQVAADLRTRAAAAAGQPDTPPIASPRGRTVFGFVDRLGRLHTWPGLLRERHVR